MYTIYSILSIVFVILLVVTAFITVRFILAMPLGCAPLGADHV